MTSTREVSSYQPCNSWGEALDRKNVNTTVQRQRQTIDRPLVLLLEETITKTISMRTPKQRACPLPETATKDTMCPLLIRRFRNPGKEL
ncbi:hypothetical protein FHS27_005688 [Rhodopirellula rubra]|uniref:Uncharacterized protein n=1 Tax=Aporhodopirellula rubra TaxID=980271 RepID=A0A7W5H8V0_9BACT|nr:hypothetical protein [Aporhodopirellula rubra]